MKGCPLISYLVLYVGMLLLTNVGETCKIGIYYTKEELINVLKNLYGGDDTTVPDFLFFDKASQTNYVKTKGPPLNRTELRRSKRRKTRKYSDAEVTLAKALNLLQNNRNVAVITRWARLLHIILFDANLEPEIQECVSQKTLGVGFGANGCPSVPSKKKKLMKKRKHWNRYRHREHHFHDGKDDNKVADDKDERESYHRKEPHVQVADQPKYVDVSQNNGPIQTADFKRMRRSLSYTYETNETCYNEGDTGATTETVFLCNVCYKTVDFGDSVVPQYANSVECVDDKPNCLGGDGSCTQKVVYYTLQKQTSETSWETVSQPLNVSCECECLTNSITHTTKVGNSNF